MSDTRKELSDIASLVRERFDAQKRVLSFQEYVELFFKHPDRHSRDAARYLKDCFDYFGTYEIDKPGGKSVRFRLFDVPHEDVARANSEARLRHEFLVGHETIQERVYRALSNFAREGRPNRLILLHGPNGSAKSTFVQCIMKGLEHYSTQDEGALYRFSWIFPRGADGKTIGFSSLAEQVKPGDTFAHLPDGQIDAKLPSELREHPLLLVPAGERKRLIDKAYAERGIHDPAPDMLRNGSLGQKNRQIFEALLTAYRGDLAKVLAHVQVERYYVSRRYRVGAVIIGPQMAVDAHERQVTADRSMGSLPASLSSLALFESFGELVDASAGVVEYSDLLKRPLDAWKYLLLAIESGEVSLPFSNLPLNCVLVATSNELHLNAFKEHHEYNSFRGRLQPIRVPYLLNYRHEQSIYDSQIVPQVRRHVAPHATFVAALWAVLTRLRRAQPEHYDNRVLGRIAGDLSPLEKAELYADGRVPSRLSNDDSMELRAGIDAVCRELEGGAVYEGLTGASPREVRTLLLDAAQNIEFSCLSPLAVLGHIEAFCARNDYDFLKENPIRGYHDHRAFIDQVRQKWLDRVDDELRTSSGLVEEAQYLDLFDKYVTHVSFWIKNERVYNRLTGKYENPDVELMERIESILDASDRSEDFRKDLISTIAAHAIDHPGQKVDYQRVFPRYLERVKEAYFGDRKKQLAALAEGVLTILAGEDAAASIPSELRTQAQETFERLRTNFGYAESSARDALGELLRRRYAT